MRQLDEWDFAQVNKELTKVRTSYNVLEGRLINYERENIKLELECADLEDEIKDLKSTIKTLQTKKRSSK